MTTDCEQCRELGKTCPDCRTGSLLSGLGRALEAWEPPDVARPVPRRSVPIGWAAAAGILLALGAFRMLRPAPIAPPPAADAPVRRAAVGEALRAGPEGLQAVWESGASALLSPGSSARASARGLALVSGSVRARGLERIETAAGFVRALSQPMTCRVEAGEVVRALLLRQAWADAAPRVTLFSGEAEWVERDGKATRLSPVPEAPVAANALILEHAAALGSGGWRLTPGPARAAASGSLPAGTPGFVWEAEIRSGPKSTLAVFFRSGGALRQWILTSRASRLRLQAWAGRLWAEVDGAPAWSCPADSPSLARFPDEGVQGDLGLVAWGDDVDLLSFRLEPATAPVVLIGSAR